MQKTLVPEALHLNNENVAGFEKDIKLYQLSSYDVLKISVYDEADLSGEYKINGDGRISFPLIGATELSGLTVYQAEEILESKLKQGYLNYPDVQVEVITYQPFSILGDVINAGNYEFREGLSLADAIAMAGGFAPRANIYEFETLRRTQEGWQRIYTRIADQVHPGDVIYIRRQGM